MPDSLAKGELLDVNVTERDAQLSQFRSKVARHADRTAHIDVFLRQLPTRARSNLVDAQGAVALRNRDVGSKARMGSACRFDFVQEHGFPFITDGVIEIDVELQRLLRGLVHHRCEIGPRTDGTARDRNDAVATGQAGRRRALTGNDGIDDGRNEEGNGVVGTFGGPGIFAQLG